MNLAKPNDQRANFIGRIQEQRQFKAVLPSLVDHHRRWRESSNLSGPDIDLEFSARDESYTRIFLLHGIGGIGKSWLTRRCLELAETESQDPPLLTLYDNVSHGAPVLQPIDLMNRLYRQLTAAGYESYLISFCQTQTALSRIAIQVARYRAENRAHWESLLHSAADFVAQQEPTEQVDASVRTRANDLLLEQMQAEGYLTADELHLFRNPPAVQASVLTAGLRQIIRDRPVVVALDNLDSMVRLEPFIRNHLVLPTIHLPLLWLLSGRHNLADERVVEIDGQAQVYKGYRDLLGKNPPLVWDMCTFGDADLRDYLVEEAHRRGIPLIIDDKLIAAVKTTSSGVPLVVEMVGDALFTLDRDEFLQNFVMDDKTLLPAGRLDQITARYLRYCLNRADDMVRVQALAVLRRVANEEALRAVWNLPPDQQVTDVLSGLRMHYVIVQADGLQDAVYDYVRRQLHALRVGTGARDLLSRQAMAYYQTEWQQVQDPAMDPAQLTMDSGWQDVARHLLNALLWADADEAICFFLLRFVESLHFVPPFAEELLLQVEQFLAEERSASLHRAHAQLLPPLHAGVRDAGWFLNEPGEAVGRMVEVLLARPGWDALHYCLLYLWQGNWLAGQQHMVEALTAYVTAATYLPPNALTVREQVGRAFYQLSSRFLWPEHPADAVPSESGLQAAQRAVALSPQHGPAWYNLGVALEYLGRGEEAILAYRQAIDIEPRSAYFSNLGDVYNTLNDVEQAVEAYQQAIELDQSFGWPYHGLAVIYSEQSEYEAALTLYEQAIQRYTRDVDRAASWDALGDVQAARGNYKEAIRAYQQAIELTPYEALPWYSLGNVYSVLERYDEAIEPYRRAIELDPYHAWSYHNLGLVYDQRGDVAPAMILFQQAVERHQTDSARALSWHSLGDVYSALERTQEAIGAYREAVKLDDNLTRSWHGLGREYSLSGRHDKALDAYRQLIRQTPAEALPWYSLGNAFSALTRHDEAIHAYRRAIELGPEEAWPYNNLGFVYQKLGSPAQALELYQQALERHEDGHHKAVTWDNLGNSCRALGKDDEALFAYRRARSLAPEYAWPYHNLGLIYEQRGALDESLRLFRQAVERHTNDPDRAVSWTKVGDIYRTQDRTRPAVDAYQQAIELDPAYAWPYHNLGLILEQQGEYEDTIGLFQQAAARHERADDRARAWNHMGDAFQGLDRLKDAIGAYRQAIELDARYALPWCSVGDVCRRLDRPDEAIDAYRRAVELDPAQAPPYHSLALIYSHRGETDRTAYEAAITLYRQAIERYDRDRDRATAWNDLGSCYQALHRLEDAIRAYHHAIELDPNYTLTWHSLGDVNRALSYFDDAITAYRKAIALEPGDARAWHSLGDVYRGLEQFDKAIEAYQQAIDLDQNYAWSYGSLGSVHEQQGQYQAALLAYQQAAQRHQQRADQAIAWTHVGDILRHLERSEEAVQAYRQAIELEPAFAWPYHYLGLMYEQQQAYEAARTAYRQAIERHNKSRERVLSWHRLGDVCLALNRHTEAITAFQRVIDLNPADAVSWNSLGTAHTALERYGAAIKALEKAIKIDPAYAWPYHNLGVVSEKRETYDAAVSYYQEGIDRHGDNPAAAESWTNLGNVYQVLERHDEAIEAYRQAIELNPDKALAWDSLGDVYRVLEYYPQAIEAYQGAIELEPTYAWPYHNLALVYADQGKYQESLPLYQHAIKYHVHVQDRAASWNNLGKVYHALGRRAEAIDAFQQAIELDPGAAWPYNNLGVILAAQGDYEPASALYRQAIQRHNSDQNKAVSWDNLGNVLTNLDQYGAAVEAYRQAVTLDATCVLSWNSLGNVYQGLGRNAEALEAYQQAIKLDPAYALPWNGLGDVYYRLERRAEDSGLQYAQAARAIEAYRRAIELNPEYAWPYHSLGSIYEQQHKYESALTYYQQAIERHGHDGPKAILWNNVGNIQRVLGQSQKAMNAYRQAIALEANLALPWFGLGNLFSDSALYEEAIEAYRRAIDLDSSNAWFYHYLALVYETLNQYEHAVSFYKQAVDRHQMDVDQAITWHNLGVTCQRWGRYQAAIAAFRQAIRLDPAWALPWNSLGGLYRELNQPVQTIKAYWRAIELNPANAQPYNNLGFYYEQVGQYEQAMSLYKQVIEHHQNDEDRAVSWNNIGNVYRVMKREQEAIEAYRQAIDLDPAFSWPYQNLGSIYDGQGNYEEALVYYQQAIRRGR